MKRQIVPTTVSLWVLCALILSACQPVPPPAASISAAAAAPTTQQAKETAMKVMDQFFDAYRTYDMNKMLSLHTDDVVWTWIDSGKSLPVLGPEGKLVGTGKDGIRAMFDLDRGQYGFSGYIVWSSADGDTVTATELWDSDYAHEIDVPLITQSTYKLRDGKIAEWVWTVSPESSRRFMNTVNTLAANKQLMTAINEEIWNQGKLDLIAKRYASNYVRHQAGYPAEPGGAEGLKQFIQILRIGFPDWKCIIEDMVAAGDKVAVRYLCRGTHTAEWNGIPATGKSLKFASTIIHQITDGKVVEDWADYDSLGWMQQLGFELVPAQKSASAYQAPTIFVQGAQIRSPNGIKAGPDGNLYVASVNERAILVINPETGKILKRLGSEVGVDGPDDLAFGPDGSLYWTDFFKGSVGRLAPDGSMSSQKVAPGVNPIILSKEGRLFVALAFLGDALYELDPKLTAPPRLLAEKLGGLNSFQFGPDGMLYAPVMEKGQVVRIDVNAKPIKVEVVAGGLAGHTYAAKLDSQGRLYTMSPPGIVRINMTTGATEPFATVPYGMDNFVFDAQDRLFASFLGEGTIAEVKPDGTLRMLGPAGLVMPGGIAVATRPEGESVFVGNFWNLHEFDGATGKLRRKVDSLGPGTIAADGENMVLSNWFSNSVLVWNPQTQKVLEEYYDFKTPLNAVRFQGDLVVAELGTGSVIRASAADPKQRTTLVKGLGVPAGLAVSKDELWVSDRATGKVWQLAAGGKVLAEPKLTASGLDRPEGMALAPGGRLLVAETGTGRLVAFDLGTGALSVIAEKLGFNPAGPEGIIPTGVMSSVAVSPSGVLYVTGDLANVVYRIEPGK
jgi:steroid delta-isomerase-like uncharacterized protein